MLAKHHAEATSPHCQILLHQMGGAFAHEPKGGTAFPNRDAAWMLTVAAIWTDPAAPAERHIAWARALWQEMRPWSTGTYVNHLGDEGAGRVVEAYGASYPRLVALKQEWDPDNVFRLNQNSPVVSRPVNRHRPLRGGGRAGHRLFAGPRPALRVPRHDVLSLSVGSIIA